MADNNLSLWAPFLYELQGKVFELFPSETPFLAEMSGYDAHLESVDRASHVKRVTRVEDLAAGRDRFSGKFVRHTVILAGLTGGGFVSETGTWNVPHALQDTEVHINLVRALFPFSVTVDVERDSMDHSSASAVATLVAQTTAAMARLENLSMMGDGTGKVQDITGGTSPGLTIQVSTTGLANMDVLLPNTVWDIATKSTAVLTTGGKGRKITTVSDTSTTQTVTFDTNAFADGDSGNITFSTNEGIYIHGSFSTPANAGTLVSQGLEQAAAVTGTFQALDKAANAPWQGTDGRAGDSTGLALSSTMLDKAVRIGRRSGLGKWDMILGDPAAIDLYKQSLYGNVRYREETITLKSGFSGIVYDGADAPIVCLKEPMHKKGAVKLIDKASFIIYGDQPGPKLLDDDGAMFRRIANRTLAKEADMLDRFQLGVGRCNTLISLNNLAIA